MTLEVVPTKQVATEVSCDAVVVGLWGDGSPTPSARAVDGATGGVIGGLVERKEATGKLYELTTLHALAGVKAKLVVVVGLGEAAKFAADTAYRTAAAAARQVSAKQRS